MIPLSNELLWLLLLPLNFFLILILYYRFGYLGLYVWIPVVIIAANTQVIKVIELFGIIATLGNLPYSASFLITDILAENHGRRRAQTGVWIGFAAMIGFIFFMQSALLFQPAPSDFAHESLENIFALLPRIAAASLAAYLISQLHDVWAYQFWRRRLPKFLWLRNNASTLVSQLIDTVLFSLMAFLGQFPLSELIEIIISTYLIKLTISLADTPFLYLAKHIFRIRFADKTADRALVEP